LGERKVKYSAHSTYYNKNKIEVPSVTTVLKILSKPFLTKWANIMGFKRKNIDDILERSSEVGTMVHKTIEAYLMNKYFIFIPSRLCSKEVIMLHLNSFIEWKRKHEVKPIFMEKHMASERFGGTVDFYGEIDGKKTILDFKTSKQPYSSYFLQLAAYTIMYEEQGYVVEQVGILNVKENGYSEKFITREKLEPYIQVFKTLVTLFHDWYELNLEEGWGNILG
jgi:predicted RecB family nuclease